MLRTVEYLIEGGPGVLPPGNCKCVSQISSLLGYFIMHFDTMKSSHKTLFIQIFKVLKEWKQSTRIIATENSFFSTNRKKTKIKEAFATNTRGRTHTVVLIIALTVPLLRKKWTTACNE